MNECKKINKLKNAGGKVKKVILISGFDTYSERVYYLERYFSMNYEVEVILSDFGHFTKEKIDKTLTDQNNRRYIETKPYKRNLSFSRIWSHFHFSKSVYNILKNEEVFLIYALIPPNFLAYFLNKLAIEKLQVKLIFDIIDLWPETFPMRRFKDNFIFRIWRNVRNNNLNNADAIVTECDLFLEKIPSSLHEKTETLYLTREDKKVSWKFQREVDDETFDICYLGSINNIIDIDFIVELCEEINKHKKVVLHVIGDGEKIDELTSRLNKSHLGYVLYGKVYGSKEKEEIFNKCLFALNVMKKDVFVGLTMKSIDYFEYGMPLINTINGDTSKLVMKYNCGYNFNPKEDTVEEYTQKLIKTSKETFNSMKEQSRKVFEENFTEEIFSERLSNIIKKM